MAKALLLKSLEKEISLTVAEKFNPKKFYKNHEGLYVWSSFIDHIVAKAKTTKADAAFKVSSFQLKKSAYDSEIEESLSKEHIFRETDVCAIIAVLIAKQPKGEKGDLLNTGYANLFYTPAFVVDVLWDGGGWNVDTWGRDVFRWLDDRRVFSPAN